MKANSKLFIDQGSTALYPWFQYIGQYRFKMTDNQCEQLKEQKSNIG